MSISEQIDNINSLDKIIEELNKTILNGELTEITEITYAYTKNEDGTYFNKTIFSNFGGIDKIIVNDFISNYNLIHKKLKDKQKIINNFLFKIRLLDNNPKQKILIESLEYINTTLEITIQGLPFEFEKTGVKRFIDDIEIQERINKIESLEEGLFGGKISDNKDESVESLNFLIKYLDKNSNKLSNQESLKYIDIITKIRIKLNIESNELNYNKKNIVLLEKEGVNIDKILNTEISRDKYIEIFKLVFEIYGLKQEVLQDERSSIYDGEDALYIPINEKYDSLSIKRVLQLIQHEIESHYLNLENNKKILGNFRGAGNLEKEEGLAMVSEKILSGENIDNIEIVQTFPKTLVGELLNGNDFKIFLDLDNKINPDKGASGRFLRLKRNYPIDYPGVQHKDTTYTRGIKKVVKYIKEGKDISDLYLGKVSFNNIGDIKTIINDIEVNYDNIQNPLMIGEVLLFMLKRDQKITRDNFLTYIDKKYNFLNLGENHIENANYSVKKKVFEIMEIINS